nr:hypothetical protein Hi04_10k_c4039_00013 [uncultured bacterium]
MCSHEHRNDIDVALLSGEPLRNVAERVSLSVTSLFRHKAHLSETLKRSQEIAEVCRADSLIEQLKQLTKDARRIQKKAEEANDYRGALAGVRELTRLVELAARLSGELNERPETKILNITLDAETAKRMTETFLARHQASSELT